MNKINTNNNIKVKVIKKVDLDKYIEDKHENNSIVITTTNRGREKLHIDKNKRNKILNDTCLQFNTITSYSPCYGGLTSKEVEEFVSFVKENIKKEKNIKRVIVSSEYGIIGGLYVAIAIMKYLDLDKQVDMLLENETYRLYFKENNYNYAKLINGFKRQKDKDKDK